MRRDQELILIVSLVSLVIQNTNEQRRNQIKLFTIGASDRARTDTLAFRPGSSDDAAACSPLSLGGDVFLLPSAAAASLSLFPPLLSEGDASTTPAPPPAPLTTSSSTARGCAVAEDDARASSSSRVDALYCEAAVVVRWVCIQIWWRWTRSLRTYVCANCLISQRGNLKRASN